LGIRERACAFHRVDLDGRTPSEDSGEQDEQDHKGADGQTELPSPDELARPVGQARRPRQNRLVAQVAPDIRGEVVRRVVSTRSVLFQRFHHDPVQIAAQPPP
jgi:hypothetical protein